MVGEALRIGFPNIHTVRHQFTHGRLEIVIADHAAGDAAGAGGDGGLVEHQNVRAVALAGCLHAFGQPPSGRQAVDSGADDDKAGVCGKTHGDASSERIAGTVSRHLAPSKILKKQIIGREKSLF